MTIKEVIETIGGRVICGNEALLIQREVEYGFASDLMSDVLTLNQENLVLITGLINNQAIRTAEMADIPCIIFVRNKTVTKEMIDLADVNNLILVASGKTSFYVSGMLYQAGLKAVY